MKSMNPYFLRKDKCWETVLLESGILLANSITDMLPLSCNNFRIKILAGWHKTRANRAA